jgi:enterochelin esterase-like enzyme
MRRQMLAAMMGSLLLPGCGGGGGASAATQPAGGTPAPTPPAGRIDALQLNSVALKRMMSVEVYVPPGYDAAKRYPVLYMFYGYGGTAHTYFDTWLPLNLNADRLLAAGRINPMLIVVPDYANSFGVNTTVEQNPNSAGGTIGLYEDYLIREMIPFIEGRYAVSDQRAQRSVGGISMGGFAALFLGLSYPALFGKVGAHSAALWDYGQTNADQFTGQRDWLYTTPELRALRDPMLLAQRADVTGMRFYLDAGASDRLLPKDQAMSEILRKRGATVTWSSSGGGHDANYWGAQLEPYLLFYAGVN